MPIKAASGAILPRICSAIARTRPSGSGSDMGMPAGIVEEALQDVGGGERVDLQFLASAGLAARPGIAQILLGDGGGERLVDHHDRNAVARGEAARELSRELRDRVLRAVGVARLAHDEGDRAPVSDAPVDLAPARLAVDRLDGAEGIGDARGSLAHRESDALLAVVESDDRAGNACGTGASPLWRGARARRGHHACPASSERLAALTPSACIAAS